MSDINRSYSEDYRPKAFEEHGEECQLCSETDDIEVHHIDGDHANDDVDNFMPVCRQCHKDIHSGEYPELTDKIKSHEEREYFPNSNGGARPVISDQFYEKAEVVKEKYDLSSIGEALRHMAREGGYDV